jgi:hypothetical protein
MTFWRLKEVLLFAFLTFTVLYYFLRFQWGWDQNIVALQALLLITISGIAVLRIIFGRGASLHPSFFYIFIAYAAALLLPTYIRGGLTGAIYGIKDYVLPALLLLGYSYFIPQKKMYSVFYCISFLGLVVSVVYFAEFVSKNILFTGYFNYTEGIRELSSATGADYLAESSFSDGIDSFFRLVGPLSHNNSTATMIAIGSLSTVPLLSSRFRILATLSLAFCMIVLLLTGSRTAAIAVIIGFVYYFRDKRVSIIFALSILISIFIAISLIVPAFIEVINITGLATASEAILSEATNLGPDRLYNLLIGSGYNFPGFDNTYKAFNGPVLNDDLFIIQLFTTYGLLPVSLFFFCVVRMRSIPKNYQNYRFFNAANAILICLTVTLVHTNALIRPQIYPVFFLMIVIKYVIHKKHQEDILSEQKNEDILNNNNYGR